MIPDRRLIGPGAAFLILLGAVLTGHAPSVPAVRVMPATSSHHAGPIVETASFPPQQQARTVSQPDAESGPASPVSHGSPKPAGPPTPPGPPPGDGPGQSPGSPGPGGQPAPPPTGALLDLLP